MNRAVNFCAGPCTLPLEVLEEAQQEFVEYAGTGMSLLEMSHRSPEYDAVHSGTMRLALEIFEVPDGFSVLFIQGGATLQFGMVPMNLLHAGGEGGYVVSGSWGRKALADGGHHGAVYAAWDGGESGYTRMPASDEIEVKQDSRYLHITSNETIGGIRFVEFPEVPVPMVADMSSDFMSRPIPWERFDLVYGGVQKNLGPAGMGVVFVRDSILEETNRNLASYLRYDVHRDTNSLHNTPPVFAVYMMGKTLEWLRQHGGLAAMERAAERKAGIIYDAMARSDGFYRSPVDAGSRSVMNVVFRLPEEALEKEFLARAEERALLNLKGHRSVGGIRASLYNAMPEAGVLALAEFMHDFRSGR